MSIDQKYIHRTLWEPTSNDEVSSVDIDGLWDISEHFSTNLQKVSPELLQMEDLLQHFRKSIDIVAKDDLSKDGRDYRLHPTATGNEDGSIFYHTQELNWWISLLSQPDSDVPTILSFARSEYQIRIDSIRGIIFKIGAEMSEGGYQITISQFRQLFLKELLELNLGVFPNPFSEAFNPITNFISTPAHLGFVLAEEPGFIYDHITQKLAYSGILGEVIDLPFGDSTPNTLDLFYHEVQTLIYDTVPDKFKSVNSTTINWTPSFDNISNIILDDSNLLSTGVYRLPNIVISPLEEVVVSVNSTVLTDNVDYELLLSNRDIAFNRYSIPVTTDLIEITINGYIDESMVPNSLVEQNRAVFDIRNYVYNTPQEQTLIRCYTPQDILDEEQKRFTAWLKVNTTWKDRHVNPFANVNDVNDPFTWNYKEHLPGIPALWYEIYEQEFYTSGPQFEPWVIQGYDNKPEWFDVDYPPTNGLYPYPSLWTAIASGMLLPSEITTPTSGFVLNAPPTYTLPIDTTTGELLPPYSNTLVNSMFTTIPTNNFADFEFGDRSPTEMSWRHSSDFLWDTIDIGYHLKPIDFVSLTWDADRMRSWVNGLITDSTVGKMFNHKDMIFFGEDEEIVENKIVTTTYDYMSDGFTNTYSGQSYSYSPIEEFTGNGLEIEFTLENPWQPGHDALVDVDGAIVTQNQHYFFVDTDGDGLYETVRFSIAPGSYAAEVGAEWDARPNSIIPIDSIIPANNEIIFVGNFDIEFPVGIVVEINDSTLNNGRWTVTNSFFDGTNTHIIVSASQTTDAIIDIIPSTNEFVVVGDQVSDYPKENRIHISGSSLYDGRWIIDDATFDGTNTNIKVVSVFTPTLSIVNEIANTIVILGDELLHTTVGTNVILDTVSGTNTTWPILSSSYSLVNDETTIVLDFPTNAFQVVDIDLVENEFVIQGFQLAIYPLNWQSLEIYASINNNGIYTITNAYYNNDGNTVIRVSDPIPSSVVDGNLTISGTISTLNPVTEVSILTGIDSNDITSINTTTNAFYFFGDVTTQYGVGTNFTVSGSVGNDATWEILTSTFNGTNTIVTVVPPRDIQSITAINSLSGTFSVLGDFTTINQVGESVVVADTIGNDGTYTITVAIFDGTSTIFNVLEPIPSPTAPVGTISLLGILDPIIQGTATITDGVIDGRLDGTNDGILSNEQEWPWDIVGWDSITTGISVPVRVRVGTPTTVLNFDENDEVDVYIDDNSFLSSNITLDNINDTVELTTPPLSFNLVTVSVYNPRDIIEGSVIAKPKLTNGLNQWYSQFYLYRGRQVDNNDTYSNYWKHWDPNVVYRSGDMINPASVIVQADGALVFRNGVDYQTEIDRSSNIKDFYIDSFLVTVSEKTETSFDTPNNTSPSSTLLLVDNFDPTRNFIKTASSRKDTVYRFTLLPTDSTILVGNDDDLTLLSFRTNDSISCIIDNVFYDIEINVVEQTITLGVNAIAAIQPLGSEVAILVEPLTKQIISHEVNSGDFSQVDLVDDLVNNTFTKATLNPTNHFVPLEFEIDDNENLLVQDVLLPALFTPKEFVVFYAEHERYLLEQGGVFDAVDNSVYRNYDALLLRFIGFVDSLEIHRQATYKERFAEFNVLRNSVKIGSEFGMLGLVKSESDYHSKLTQDILDINGDTIDVKELHVIREDSLAEITLVADSKVKTFTANGIFFTPTYISDIDPSTNSFPTEGQIWFNEDDSLFYSYDATNLEFVLASTVSTIEYKFLNVDKEMYTAHFTIDTFESIIRFENESSIGRSVYKPLTGSIIRRVYTQFEKARVYNGRPNISGFGLVQNNSGLLEPVRNIESQIHALTNMYDVFNGTFDNNFGEAVPDLLGLETKPYLQDFLGGGSPRSTIGFQQGFIQQKGARDNVKAFTEAIRSIPKMDLFEVWAYKLAEYGDNTGDDYVILSVSEKEGARTTLGLHFTDAQGLEVPDPTLVEIKENEQTRFPQLLDSVTTKDGSRFYFPAIEEGSNLPEWERNWIVNVLEENNNFAGQISNLNEYGFDFGTFGQNAFNRTVRIAGVTLYQSQTDFTTVVDIQYYDEITNVWITLAKDVQVNRLTDYDEVQFPVHNISARRWKLVATELNAGQWSTQFEFHKYRAIADYKRISSITAQNNQTNALAATWYPWDPIEGMHTPEPYQYIDHETDYDPAIYSQSIGDSNRIEQSRAWGEERVGDVWWDKSDYSVIDYKNVKAFPSSTQRASLWGKLESGKKVSVYEWVKSPVHPSEYAKLVEDAENSEDALTTRIPTGIVKSINDFTVEVKVDENIFYYFWVKGQDIRSYSNNGQLRSLSIKQIAAGLESPDNIHTNKFYIIDNYLDSSPNWIPGALDLPARFTQWFGNATDQVFTSDYIELHFNRKFLLAANLNEMDFRSNRHEEWALMHPGQPDLPPIELWDEMVGVLADQNCSNAIDWDSNDPDRCFMPRDELLRLLNRRVVEIKPDFFSNGFESPTITGNPSFEKDTPFDGAAENSVFDINSLDPYRRIRSLGDSNVTYFDGESENLVALMDRNNPLSFYNTSTAEQVNALFFDILEESIAFDTKKSNVFKTSWIAYNAEKLLDQPPVYEGSLRDLNLILDFVETEAKPFHTHINPDISTLNLVYNEDVLVEVSDQSSIITNLNFNEDILISIDENAVWNITMDYADDVGVSILDESFPADVNNYTDSMNVGFEDSLEVGMFLRFNDNVGVGVTEELRHSIAIVEYPQFTETVQVAINEELNVTEYVTFGDTMNVGFTDMITGVEFTVGPDNAGVGISEAIEMSFGLNLVESISVEIEEGLVTEFNNDILGGDESVSVGIDEKLRIDVESYDSVKNWYYGFYMLHDGGENLSYIPGSPYNTDYGALIVGYSPGLDESPSSEEYYRFDDIHFDDVWHISSFDNFGMGYDMQLLGQDSDTIGRVGYNSKGVNGELFYDGGSNTAKFILSRPKRSGLDPNFEYQYTHTQTVLSDEWIVHHDLAYLPVIRVYDTNGFEIVPLNVVSNFGVTVLQFTAPIDGIARAL